MPGQSLLRFYEQNIAGIRAAVNSRVPGNGRMLVCYQPDSQNAADLFEIFYHPGKGASDIRELKHYDDFSAGDPACVRQLLADVGTLSPADSYGVIVGCHGKAWIPGSIIPFSLLHKGGGQYDDLWTPAPGALPTRSFGDKDYSLEIETLASALTAQQYHTDYVIFDACFMANIETLYDLRNCTDYVIASPCEIMGEGFPYRKVLPNLFTENGASHDLPAVCRGFWDFYTNEAQWKSGCISLAVTSELPSLATIVQQINAAGRRTYTDELQVYEGMIRHLFFDFGQYIALVCDNEQLLSNFKKQFDKAFPLESRLHTPEFYSAYNKDFIPVTHYSGISTSEPATAYTEELRQTSWYRQTHAQ